MGDAAHEAGDDVIGTHDGVPRREIQIPPGRCPAQRGTQGMLAVVGPVGLPHDESQSDSGVHQLPGRGLGHSLHRTVPHERDGPLPLGGQTQVLEPVPQGLELNDVRKPEPAQGGEGVLGLHEPLVSQVGNQHCAQPPGGLHGIDLGTVRSRRRGTDDAGVVVMHAGGGQDRASIGLAEGEESRLTELFEGLVPEAEDGGELHLGIAQWKRRAAVSRPEPLAEGHRLVEALLAHVRVLAQLNQPRPVDGADRLHHLFGRVPRSRPLDVVSGDRLPQGRCSDTTGADGVDILQSTGNATPIAHIVSNGRHVQVPTPRKRGVPAPATASHRQGARAMGRRHLHLRVSACGTGRDPQIMSEISPDQ